MMVTDIFITTLLSGKVTPQSAAVMAVPFSQDLDLPVTVTSATGLLQLPSVVRDTTMPSSGYAVDYLPSKNGVKLRLASDAVVKFDKPQLVEGVMVYIEGVTDGVSDMIVSYSKVDSNTYYNLVMSGGVDGAISIISV